MSFDFEFLKEMEQKHESLGNWKGIKVMAASKQNLWKLGSGVFYIVYDDLVGKCNDNEGYRTYGRWRG